MKKKKFLPLRPGSLKIANLYGLTSKTVQISSNFLNVIKLPLLDTAFSRLKLSSSKLGTQLQNYERGSVLTPEVSAADKQVTIYFDDFRRRISASIKSSDPNIAEITKPLYYAVKPYWKTTTKRLITQMEEMQLLFTHIDDSTELLATLDTLGFANLWDKLKQAATVLQTVYDARAVDITTKGEAPSKTQGEVVLDYDMFCDIVSQALTMTPSSELSSLFDEINEVRHKYATGIKKSITHRLMISDIPDQIYTGECITPVTSEVYYIESYRSRTKLYAGKDFINTYEDNIKPGIGSIVYHGKGKYNGKQIMTFRIIEA
jgi:hypothetical protein